MCFRVTLDTKHAIAKEPIEVYKMGFLSGANFIPCIRKEYLYLRDVIPKQVKLSPYNNIINEGYHSYDLISCDQVLEYMNVSKRRDYEEQFTEPGFRRFTIPLEQWVMSRFEIPVGAEYYMNHNVIKTRRIVEYVSNQIIYRGEL